MVVSGKYTEELHRAPDDVLSFDQATRDVSFQRLKFQHTHLSTILDGQNRLHYGGTHRKGSMA